MRVKQIVLTILFLAVALTLQSQPDDPATDPDRVPITGLEYLLIGGGAYGVSRLLKNRKNKPNES
jgi:hypothetical protein